MYRTKGKEFIEAENEPKMYALTLLNEICKQTTRIPTPSKGLMYIETKFNGVLTRALVDMGATHNFMSEGEVKKLGLKSEKYSSHIKAVNLEVQQVAEVEKGVSITVGSWNGRTDIMVFPLDDFWIILGMDFLQGTKVLPMPYLRSFGENPCMLLAIQKGKEPIRLLLALPVKKLKNGIPSCPVYGGLGNNYYPTCRLGFFCNRFGFGLN